MVPLMNLLMEFSHLPVCILIWNYHFLCHAKFNQSSINNLLRVRAYFIFTTKHFFAVGTGLEFYVKTLENPHYMCLAHQLSYHMIRNSSYYGVKATATS